MNIINSKFINIGNIVLNKGHIKDLPKNPRFIKDEKFKKLVQSIKENPEMTALRELLVYPFNNSYVIIGGNMRYRAMKELGYKECLCKVIPKETSIEQLKAYIIKDNSNFGEWDLKALVDDDWGNELLDICDIDLSITESEIDIDKFFDNIDKTSEKGEKITILLPGEDADMKDEIKALIKTLLAEYKGIKIK